MLLFQERFEELQRILEALESLQAGSPGEYTAPEESLCQRF
jgi:hypothetical protein